MLDRRYVLQMLQFVRSERNLFVHMGAVQRFAREQLDRRSRHSERLRADGRSVVCVTVIVVLEILEDVTDVQESIAVEPNFDERRLHAGEDAGDFAFVNAADEGELFFALNVNFN
jgi:hypothetical protein